MNEKHIKWLREEFQELNEKSQKQDTSIKALGRMVNDLLLTVITLNNLMESLGLATDEQKKDALEKAGKTMGVIAAMAKCKPFDAEEAMQEYGGM